ncbi:MAG: hypothetical protein LBT44_02815 [Clostridiales bacterium]|jgi:hypothetical protein|nr:hypothetical protein [Clostridiales bacterium]
MAISAEELIAKVNGLQKTATDLSNMLKAAGTNLSKSVAALSPMTRGSKTGMDATAAVSSAAVGVDRAAVSLFSLGNFCEEFIQNAKQ